MSSPSRSDTNHLMVESLLQQKGWEEGWATLLASAGNLVTISSRSFGVADKIKSGLGVAGPVIDNYANLLLNDPHRHLPIFHARRYRQPMLLFSITASTPMKRVVLSAIC